MTENLENIETPDSGSCDTYISYSCDCPVYTSQLEEINNNIVILNETLKGGNSINLLLLCSIGFICIYRLLRFIF